jgi:hypothetical protein
MDAAVPMDAKERAHRDLENREERGFPQRPHALLLSWKRRQRNASHTEILTLPNHGILPATNVTFGFTDVIAPESQYAPPDDSERTTVFAFPPIAPSAIHTYMRSIIYSKDLKNPTFIKIRIAYKNGSGVGETLWCRTVLTRDTLLPTRDHNDMT